VPVGVFLSGGLDSSLLVALASQEKPNIETFTVGFRGHGREIADADESAFARTVAEAFGTRHHQQLVDEAALLRELDAAFAAMDEPIADPAIVPLLVMASFARTEVTVCLTGDGGDELFGGYFRHRVDRLKRAYHAMPAPLRLAAGLAAGVLPRRPRHGRADLLRKARVGFDMVASPEYLTGPFAARYLPLLRDNARRHAGGLARCGDASTLELDVVGELSGQFLPKTDRISMRAGLEARVPFLDLELVAFARGLERRNTGNVFQSKVLMRALAERLLPRTIARRRKQGFRLPISGWLRGPLRDRAEACVRNPALEPWIERSSAERMLGDHLAGRDEHGIRVWALLALEAWLHTLAEVRT